MTAVMVTRNDPARRTLLQRAVACFLAQTHVESDLLIINDGQSCGFSHPRIREITVPREQNLSLGALRNLAFEYAAGDWLIQWDDDDWYDPRRIEIQFQRRSHAACVLLESQIRLHLGTGEAFEYRDGSGIHGTILHHREVPWRYPAVRPGEDTVFLNSFPDRRIVQGVPEIYVRLFHGSNTWDEAHIMARAHGKKVFPLSDETQGLIAGLAAHYRASSNGFPRNAGPA